MTEEKPALIIENVIPPLSTVQEDSIETAATTLGDVGKNVHNNFFKAVLVGDCGVGKTSIIKMAAYNKFSPTYRLTLGLDYVAKEIQCNNEKVKIQLWDIFGQEQQGQMLRTYLKDGQGVFAVFDCTRPETFDSIIKWKNAVDSKLVLPDGSPVPILLLANKCDDPEKKGIVTTPTELDAFCTQNGFVGWMETSAKENINITEALVTLGVIMLSKKSLYPKPAETKIIDNEEQFMLSQRVREVELSGRVEQRQKKKCCK